ncbi:MAG: phenylacetate--CoA ligase family protein, partial [Candidatus Atribacteria bacterium]|nr:phenylacetate--CoA ligase family protein [Candidatus Atribacteria bacterium]
MKEEDMNEYVKKINAIKPKLILAYTNSMNLFARFIQEHQLTIHPVRAIMTSSGVLFPEIRSRIEEVFHTTSIFDRYGSREVGDIACNCKNSQGLHLVPDIHYLEIVDDEGKSLPPGQSGNILITLLTNYTMPLIRYKIGDLGIMSLGKNQCGHDLPTLEKVIGRINASFKNKFGDFIITGIFYPLFYFKEDIKQFQMIQEEVDLILINLVLTEKGKLTDMRNYFREIEAKIEKIMGHKTTVQFHILDEIKPSPSGKYLYAFSKIYQSINT